MTNKAEKLAWELLGLISKYKPKEVEEAIALLEGSKILLQSTRLLRQVSKSRIKMPAKKYKESRAPLIDEHFLLDEAESSSPKQPMPTADYKASEGGGGAQSPTSSSAPDELDRTARARTNFMNLSESDQNIIRDLAEGLSSGIYLKTSSFLRDYASRLDINLPRKLPSRSVIALQIVEEILLLDAGQMRHFVEAAKSMSGDVSSLEKWSNLIVRRN